MVYGEEVCVALMRSARRLADPQTLAGHVPSIYPRGSGLLFIHNTIHPHSVAVAVVVAVALVLVFVLTLVLEKDGTESPSSQSQARDRSKGVVGGH